MQTAKLLLVIIFSVSVAEQSTVRHTILDASYDSWRVFFAPSNTRPTVSRYGLIDYLSHTDDWLSVATTVVDADDRAYGAVQTSKLDIPLFDDQRCSERQIEFEATVDWRVPQLYNSYLDKRPGMELMALLTVDDTPPDNMQGLIAAVRSGSDERYKVFANADFTYPNSAMGYMAGFYDCSVRNQEEPCIYDDATDKPLLRNETLRFHAKFDLIVANATMVADSLHVEQLDEQTGQFSTLFALDNTGQNNFLQPVAASAWMGALDHPARLFLGLRQLQFNLTDFSLTAVDQCTPTTTSASETPSATDTTAASELPTVVSTDETLTATDRQVTQTTSQLLSTANQSTTTETQPTMANTTTDAITALQDDKQVVETPDDADIITPLLVAMGACICCLLVCFTIYVCRKRIRRSNCFSSMYWRTPCLFSCCCDADKVPRATGRFVRLTPAEQYLSGDVDLQRKDDPPPPFGSMPPDVGQHMSPNSTMRKRSTVVVADQEYGTLPVNSAQDGYAALPAHAGQPETKRSTPAERRKRRTARRNQYDRVEARKSQNPYDPVYSQAPPPANAPTIVYDQILVAEQKGEQSMELSDVSTDYDNSAPQQYDVAPSKFEF